MSTMTQSSFAKALWPGVNAWYGKSYNDFSVEYTDIFDTYTSRKAFEEDVGLSSFGLAVVKDQAAPVTFDSEKQGFTTRYTHVTYGLGFIVTKELFDDDLYDVVGQRRAKGLARSVRQTKEILGANVLNRAFNSSYSGGDGKELLSTTHPNIAGGTFSNKLTTDADVSEAALEQACIDIGKYTDDRGLRIAVKPLSIIAPIDLEFELKRILGNPNRPETPNRDINALVASGRFPGGVKLNHYLTDTDAWFIKTDAPEGLKYFERRPDSFDMDNDWDTENAKFKVIFRCAFGWTEPKVLYGSQGA
jgi:hypothetical protein